MKDYELICTIGPSCEDRLTLESLKNAGVDIFRVNMSHASIDSLSKFCDLAKEIDFALGIDTEGAQIRTKIKDEEVLHLKKGDTFDIPLNKPKNKDNFLLSFYPFGVARLLKEGLQIRLDFNGAVVQVIKCKTDSIQLECINSGKVENNKGVDILNSTIELPDFTEKDLEALNLGREKKISEIFISFCKSSEAIRKVKEIIPKARVTSKIENKLSIHNLKSICKFADALLIDRGDLTREINIMDIPFAQRGIVKIAKENNIPCFIATNVLESLIKGNLPTRAELNDIVGTLEMGASGIVLAAETAIGNKPILCAEIVYELIHRFQLHQSGLLFADIERNEITDKEMRVWLNR